MHGHEVGVAGALAVAVDRALHAGWRRRRTAATELATAQPESFWVWMPIWTSLEVGGDLGRRCARPRGAATRRWCRTARAQSAPFVGRGLEHPQRELGVGLVAVEEVLGVEEHPQPLALAGTAPSPPTMATPSSSVVCSASVHVVVPRTCRRCRPCRRPGLDQRAQRRVVVDLAQRPAGRAEGHQRRRSDSFSSVRRAAEELLVLRVGLRVAALDPVDAEAVELLGDAQLVLDGERDALELGAVAQRGVEDLDRRGQARRVRRIVGRPRPAPHRAQPTCSHPVLVAVDLAADGLAVLLGDGRRSSGRGTGSARSSTEFTALTSAAVPHTNISSAM